MIHGPDIPGSYAILLFTASDLASLTSHIHSWVLFLLWLHPFIPSGVISPLFSSSLLGTYRPGDFIFQCPIFLPFHIVHGVLKARMQKWFAIPSSSGQCFVRPLHHDPSTLVGPTLYDSNSFIELHKAVVRVISLVSGVIYIYEVIDISPGNLDSSLCLIHTGIFMMYSAYKLNKEGDNIQH